MLRFIVIALLPMLAACDDSSQPAETTGLVVFMGDSITASWPLQNYVMGVVNAGVTGETTELMLARFESEVLSLQPAAVVILGGINDINRYATANPANVLAMAQMALAANAKVFVCTVLPATDPGIADPALIGQLIPLFNQQLAAGALQYGYGFVDFYDAMLLRNGDSNRKLFLDGVHPNTTGYRVMWKALRPALESQGLLLE